jgi:hypothetical protein
MLEQRIKASMSSFQRLTVAITVALALGLVPANSRVQGEAIQDHSTREAITGPSGMAGLFYVRHSGPSDIHGSFWLYAFSDGKGERLFEFKESPFGNPSSIIKGNLLLHDDGGTLTLYHLPSIEPVVIARDVPEDQFFFAPDGNSIVYLSSTKIFSSNGRRGGSIRLYTISTRQTTQVMDLNWIDTLLGTNAKTDTIYYTVDDDVYAIHDRRSRRLFRPIKDRMNPYDWTKYSLSPDGSALLMSKELRRGGIVELGIFSIPRHRYTMLDMILAEQGIYVGFDRVGFSDDSKYVVGYHSNHELGGSTYWTFSSQTLKIVSKFDIAGFPVGRYPGRDIYLVRDIRSDAHHLYPEESLPHVFAPPQSTNVGDNASMRFIGWYVR